MKKKIVLMLEESEVSALEDLAFQEVRGIEQQAEYMIREELKQRGLLKDTKLTESKEEDEIIRFEND